jgi:anhydro-N-acetylmuramic acid kinase
LQKIFVCGGGAKNEALLWGIQQRLPETQVLPLDAAGFDSQFVEAQGFAIFGLMALLGQPVGGSWTGAKGFGPPAHIVPGENWEDVFSTISTFR